MSFLLNESAVVVTIQKSVKLTQNKIKLNQTHLVWWGQRAKSTPPTHPPRHQPVKKYLGGSKGDKGEATGGCDACPLDVYLKQKGKKKKKRGMNEAL